MKNIVKFIFLLSLIFAADAMAVTCTSIANKDWNSSRAWMGCNNGQPPTGSSVIIASGTVIKADSNTNTVANITINAGGTLQGKNGNTISFSGNFINNGTFTAGGGKVALTGTNQTIGGTSTTTFFNLSVGAQTVVTLTGNIVVTGTTNLTAAKIASTCPTNFTITTAAGVLNSCTTTPPPTGNVTVTMNPGSCVNTVWTGIGKSSWAPTPTTNVNLNDTLYATTTLTGTSNYLQCSAYGFTIPANATIVGVVVNVQRKSSRTSRTTDGAMRLVKAGVIGTVDRSTATTYTTVDVAEPHGTATDLWGTTWTPADINAANFGAAFATKATKKRTVSVNHMPISVTYSVPSNVPHHIQIEHDGSGLTCAAEQVTIRACADAACTKNLTGAAVTGNLLWTGGGSTSFTIQSGGTGQVVVAVPVSTAQTVTLSINSVTPTPVAASSCLNTAGGTSCSLTFAQSSVCIDAVEQGGTLITGIYTKLSGVPFSLDLLTTSGANYNNANVTVELVDALAGTSCATRTSLSAQNVNFPNVNRKTVNFTYAGAVKQAKVRVTGLGAPSCSADKFAIRPSGFTVTSNLNADATGTNPNATPVLAAGANFTLTATAVSGYDGTPAINIAKVSAHTGAVANGQLTGVFSPANPATGVASGSTFAYNEVGYFKLAADGVLDTTFANIDTLDGDCTLDASNSLVGGKYGCYIGHAATPYFGRFVPDHFDTVATNKCDIFTYSGQPFLVEVQAKDAAGTTILQNYEPPYSKAVMLSDSQNAASVGALAPTIVSNFSLGTSASNPAYSFAVLRTAPTTVTVAATEVAGGDGVSSTSSKSIPVASFIATEGSVDIRSGRLWLGNAYGSELLDLPAPLFAQYWDGSTYLTNVDDDVAATCTAVSTPTLVLQPGGTAVTATMNNMLIAGDGGLVLMRPNVSGYVDVTVAAPTWLRYDWAGTGVQSDPTARATFGVYKGKDVYIYRGRRGR